MLENENQTIFAQEEPFMEPTQVPPLETVPGQVAPKKPRNKGLLILLAIVGLLFVSLLVVAMTMPRGIQQLIPEPSPTPNQEQQQRQNELDEKLELLREDMLKADPAINDLPVPPIEFELTLEED